MYSWPIVLGAFTPMTNYYTLGWPRGPPPLQTWGDKILEKHPCLFVLYYEIVFLPWWFAKIFHAYNAGGNHFDWRLFDQVLRPLWIYLPTKNGWRRPWICFETFFDIKCLKYVSLLHLFDANYQILFCQCQIWNKKYELLLAHHLLSASDGEAGSADVLKVLTIQYFL